jgi:hypothetical protein
MLLIKAAWETDSGGVEAMRIKLDVCVKLRKHLKRRVATASTLEPCSLILIYCVVAPTVGHIHSRRLRL